MSISASTSLKPCGLGVTAVLQPPNKFLDLDRDLEYLYCRDAERSPPGSGSVRLPMLLSIDWLTPNHRLAW